MLPARLAALEADLRRHGHGTHYRRGDRPRRAAAHLEAAHAGPGPVDGREGRRQGDLVRRGHRGQPRTCLRDYIAEFLAVVRRHGTTAGVYAHASVGCLHVRPVVDLKTVAGVARFQAHRRRRGRAGAANTAAPFPASTATAWCAARFRKKCSARSLYEAFRELKRTFDPHDIFNPGKIVDAPPLTANLRYGPAYVTPEVPTTFDFTADGGMARAAELCAGVGECRKQRGGTMCPSLPGDARGAAQHARPGQRAAAGADRPVRPARPDRSRLCTRRSTCAWSARRARASARPTWTWPGSRRSSCTSIIADHGLPLRNRVFGHVARLSRWGSRLAPRVELAAAQCRPPAGSTRSCSASTAAACRPPSLAAR